MDNYVSDAASMSTSSISEYLMETLPGWRVDDFLDPNGFCKTGASFFTFGDNQDLQTSSLEDSSDYPWAPQISPESNQFPFDDLPRQSGLPNCAKKSTEAKKLILTQKWSSINDGLVPQISPPSLNSLKHVL